MKYFKLLSAIIGSIIGLLIIIYVVYSITYSQGVIKLKNLTKVESKMPQT